jgi:hypothetical protein
MQSYFYLTIFLNILVDFLLLVGANRLAGFPHRPLRCILAAGISGIYAGLCLKLSFLGLFPWHFTVIVLICIVAYGISITAFRRAVLFVLLRLAVGGIASGFSEGKGMGLLAAAAMVSLLCLLGFGGRAYGREYIPVELCYEGKKLRLLALRDTGNMLRDPITGQAVLVVDAAAGETLLGLTPEQLSDPIATVASASVPGLRLLPYRSIGSPQGMLAAIRLHNTKIGNFRGSTVVAFAPQKLDSEGIYRGLTGGIV